MYYSYLKVSILLVHRGSSLHWCGSICFWCSVVLNKVFLKYYSSQYLIQVPYGHWNQADDSSILKLRINYLKTFFWTCCLKCQFSQNLGVGAVLSSDVPTLLSVCSCLSYVHFPFYILNSWGIAAFRCVFKVLHVVSYLSACCHHRDPS